MESYLQMASLHRILDHLPCKQVFAIFDVCFGGSFDQIAPDIELNSYNQSADINSVELMERKSAYHSRIFLASGQKTVPDYWGTNNAHSPFALKLIESLSTTTDFTSPGRLYKAVEGNATEPVLRRFGKHEERGDFILPVQY